MKKALFLILFPMVLFGQVQIGENIYGDYKGYQISTLCISSNGNVVAFSNPYANNENGISQGEVKVYKNIDGSWVQLGNDIIGNGDEFGTNIALSSNGNIIAISAPRAYNKSGLKTGVVKVFQNSNDEWTQIGENVDGENHNDFSGGYNGLSLSDDGQTIAIGAQENDDNGARAGHVRVFKNIDNSWTQVGQDIDGKKPMSQFGRNVSLSANGEILAVSSLEWDDVNKEGYRFLSVFKSINNVWTQVGNDIQGDVVGGVLSLSTTISGNGLVLAILEGESSFQNTNYHRGQVKVYKQIDDEWVQIGNKIDGETWGSLHSGSVSLSEDGNIMAIGIRTPKEDGYVQMFINLNNDWTHLGTITRNDLFDNLEDDNLSFGGLVSLSADGNTLLANGGYDWNNSSTIGYVKVFDVSDMILSTKNYEDAPISIYPNPTSDKFTIKLKSDTSILYVNIYNNLDQIICKTNAKTITTNSWARGIYFVEIITNTVRTTKKIIIK